MALIGVFCPKCNALNTIIKYGHIKNSRRQQYFCVSCKKVFSGILLSPNEINAPSIGICECCGGKAFLYVHHWFEPNDSKRHTRLVCPSCNNHLVGISCEIWDSLYAFKSNNHCLPSWDFQQEYVSFQSLPFLERLKKHNTFMMGFAKRLRALYV